MSMKKNEIERLVDMDPNKVQAPALKAALELHQKQQAERDAQQALSRISEIENIVGREVHKLREVRKEERRIKERLERIVAAKEQFFKDGDWSAFVKEYHSN